MSEEKSHLFSFGQNSYGELGLNSDDKSLNDNQCTPAAVEFCRGKRVKMACAGNEHTAILLETGEVYTCGYNNSGQCGVGRIGRVPSFERVAALADVNVKFLCSSNGCEHLIAVSQSGKAYACGYNGRGQLGLGHTHHEVIPVPLRGKLLNKKVIFVACTYYHSALYVASHEVYTFGRNSHGQLGLSDTVDRLEPERVPTLGSRAISAIACGHYHTCFALTSGGVLSCGKNDYGQIGQDFSEDMKLSPTPVVSSLGHSELVIAIAAGYYHTLALTSKGELYTYGRNDYGQLGLGTLEHTFRPTQVQGPLRDVRIVRVASGCYHSVVLDEHRRVFSFGRNNHGQLGTGNLSDSKIPRHVHGLSLVRVESIAAGFYHTLCVAETQSVKTQTIRSGTARSLSRDLRALLDDDTCSDVTFLVESKPIHAHRCIVMARCEPLRAMMQAPMLESTMCELEIQDVKFETFRGLLEFLYTDTVRALFDSNDDVDKEDEKEDAVMMSSKNENQRSSSISSRDGDVLKEASEESNSSTNNEEENHNRRMSSSKEEEDTDRKEKKEDNLGFALDLFSVADRFLVTELRDLCTDVILRGIRVENVSKIYSMADRRMLHDLRQKCLFFMMNHFSRVITTQEFSLMEPALIQEILTEASKRGVFLRTLP